MPTIQELLHELEHEARTTRRVLERVPDDQLDWRPHEKSRSLGELSVHVATIPGNIARMAAQAEFDVRNTPAPPTAVSSTQLVELLDRSMAEAKAALGEIDDAALARPWRMMKGDHEIMTMPRGALLRTVMLNHWYHHRGMMAVYLRQVGALVPAIYGDSADEKPFPRR